MKPQYKQNKASVCCIDYIVYHPCKRHLPAGADLIQISYSIYTSSKQYHTSQC